MNKRQIEAWALQIIDGIKDGALTEDSLVELKRTFPEAPKAARRIAGHANAARGESILWLIGVDERQGIVGINNDIDLASWWPQVESCFDGIAPYLTDLIVPSEDKRVIALLFETDRAPFVVKNSYGGAIQFEVPWRSGTKIRSAKREEIIRIIAPLERIPDLEITHGYFYLVEESDFDEYFLSIDIYMIPKTDERVIVPFHKCSISVREKGKHEWLGIDDFSMLPEGRYEYNSTPDKEYKSHAIFRKSFHSTSPTINSTKSELIIDGAGLVHLKANIITPRDGEPFAKSDINSLESIEVKFILGLSNYDKNISRLMSFKIDTYEMNPSFACAWSLDEVE